MGGATETVVRVAKVDEAEVSNEEMMLIDDELVDDEEATPVEVEAWRSASHGL